MDAQVVTKSGELRVDASRFDLVLKREKMNMVMLAEKAGMHYNGILRIKTTGRTSLETLALICDILKCHPFDLLVANGYPEPFCLAPASH